MFKKFTKKTWIIVASVTGVVAVAAGAAAAFPAATAAVVTSIGVTAAKFGGWIKGLFTKTPIAATEGADPASSSVPAAAFA